MRILVFIVAVLTAAAASAQVGGPYELRPSAIAGGGGASDGGEFLARGTVGQSATTLLSDTSYVLTGGFWPAHLGVGQPTPSTTPASASPTATPTGVVSPPPTQSFTPTTTIEQTLPTSTPTAEVSVTSAPPTSSRTPTATQLACVGDCAGDGSVTVDEIVRMVSIALGVDQVESCLRGDSNGDGDVTVDEIVAAVDNALDGCEM